MYMYSDGDISGDLTADVSALTHFCLRRSTATPSSKIGTVVAVSWSVWASSATKGRKNDLTDQILLPVVVPSAQHIGGNFEYPDYSANLH